MKINNPSAPILVSTIEIPIRFSESDAMGVVWHGNYIKYFEDGRDAFGRYFKIKYLDVYGNGFVTPIVHLVCDYKQSLKYGDTAIIETTYVDSLAAKLIYKYRVLRGSDREVMATGESIQVFLEKEGGLQLTIPAFFAEWKQKMGLI
jgi:acyl-CoA thioester hydrolase